MYYFVPILFSIKIAFVNLVSWMAKVLLKRCVLYCFFVTERSVLWRNNRRKVKTKLNYRRQEILYQNKSNNEYLPVAIAISNLVFMRYWFELNYNRNILLAKNLWTNFGEKIWRSFLEKLIVRLKTQVYVFQNVLTSQSLCLVVVSFRNPKISETNFFRNII